MPYVTISDAAMRAICNAAGPGFQPTGLRLGPDEWRVLLQDKTVARVQEYAFEGESFSDCVLRVSSGRAS